MSLWEQAASSYVQAGALEDAARCFREAGHYRQAADYYLRIGQLRSAAPMFELAGDPNQAAWLLVHADGGVAEARAVLARHPVDLPADPQDWSAAVLLHLLAAARCDVAESSARLAGPGVLALLADVQQALAGTAPVNDPRVRDWSVALAATIQRLDQVALIFAAAVRGRRIRAAEAWQTWARDHFGTPIIVPAAPAPVPAAAGAPAGRAAGPADG